MKAYLKIGMYQSVVPVPVPPDDSCVLRFGSTALEFFFRDSGAKEDDGTPIWIAENVRIDYKPKDDSFQIPPHVEERIIIRTGEGRPINQPDIDPADLEAMIWLVKQAEVLRANLNGWKRAAESRLPIV